MKFNQKVKFYRKRLGLTQEELAAEAGVSLGTIRNYEQDIRKPNDRRLRNLAKALEIKPVELIDGIDVSFIPDLKDKRVVFTEGYENSEEQLIFYDELERFRRAIDKIDDKKKRLELARKFNDLLECLNTFKEEESSEEPKDSRKEFNKRYQKVSKVVDSAEDIYKALNSE